MSKEQQTAHSAHSKASRLTFRTTGRASECRTKYLYDPYGTLLSQSGPLASANNLRFASKEATASTALVLYGRRFYDANLQRWINRDPIQEIGDLNLYRFTKNDANDFMDPWGKGYFRQYILDWGQYSYTAANGNGVVVGVPIYGYFWVDDGSFYGSRGENAGGNGGGSQSPRVASPRSPCHIWEIYDSAEANEAMDRRAAEAQNYDRELLNALGQSAKEFLKNYLKNLAENPGAFVTPVGPLGELGGEGDALAALLAERNTAGTATSVAIDRLIQANKNVIATARVRLSLMKAAEEDDVYINAYQTADADWHQAKMDAASAANVYRKALENWKKKNAAVLNCSH
jgi:RHS repeat-associated protein